MAAPDPDHPSMQLQKISSAVYRADWQKLRIQAFSDGLDAQEIVRELVHQYVAWPADRQAALLRLVHNARGDG